MSFSLLYLTGVNRRIEKLRTSVQQKLKQTNDSLLKTNAELELGVYTKFSEDPFLGFYAKFTFHTNNC